MDATAARAASGDRSRSLSLPWLATLWRSWAQSSSRVDVVMRVSRAPWLLAQTLVQTETILNHMAPVEIEPSETLTSPATCR